jgi:hypothetical protein
VSQRGDRLTFSVNGSNVLEHTLPGASASPARIGIFVGGDLNQVAVQRFGVRTPEIAPAASTALAIRTVPLTASELDQVDREQPAMIRAEAGSLRTDRPQQPAAPSLGAPQRLSSPLVYPLSDRAHGLTAGQRVPLEITLLGNQAQSRIVPHSAVVYDATGAAWVYVESAPLIFVRQAIAIDSIAATDARNDRQATVVISDGPPVGASVVVVGAAQLYSIELGPTANR